MLTRFLAEDTWANQYTDTGWFGILVSLLVIAFVLLNIARGVSGGRTGKDLFIRRIAGLNAIDEAVGRATEMGRPIVMVPGIGTNVDAVVMQALKIFSYIARIAGKFANPILLCCGGAPVYTVAQEVIRDVYQQEGIGDRFDPDSVRFISDRQFALAAGVSGLILREQAAAAFFMGDFYAESLIFAESAYAVGAIQVASSTQTTQTPFFIAACDYVLIGDEFYAAGAYLTRQPILVGSLVGQDWSKMLVGTLALIGALMVTTQLGIGSHRNVDQEKKDGKVVKLDAPREAKGSDTTMFWLFHPQEEPDLASGLQRTQYPHDQQSEPDDKVTNWTR